MIPQASFDNFLFVFGKIYIFQLIILISVIFFITKIILHNNYVINRHIYKKENELLEIENHIININYQLSALIDEKNQELQKMKDKIYSNHNNNIMIMEDKIDNEIEEYLDTEIKKYNSSNIEIQKDVLVIMENIK